MDRGIVAITALAAGFAIAKAPDGGPVQWLVGAVIVAAFLWTYFRPPREAR